MLLNLLSNIDVFVLSERYFIQKVSCFTATNRLRLCATERSQWVKTTKSRLLLDIVLVTNRVYMRAHTEMQPPFCVDLCPRLVVFLESHEMFWRCITNHEDTLKHEKTHNLSNGNSFVFTRNIDLSKKQPVDGLIRNISYCIYNVAS